MSTIVVKTFSKVVTCSFAFELTGVDYLRPIYVKQVYSEHDDTPLFKPETVLFTWAAARAVHLDLGPDPSSTSFI